VFSAEVSKFSRVANAGRVGQRSFDLFGASERGR
jgi:hypothetical protein